MGLTLVSSATPTPSDEADHLPSASVHPLPRLELVRIAALLDVLLERVPRVWVVAQPLLAGPQRQPRRARPG